MSIEILECAVARLEELKAGALGLPWSAESIPETGESRIMAAHDEATVAPGAVNEDDAELIVALSRTVDPLIELFKADLAWLREDPANRGIVGPNLALAHAVLGESDGE